MLRPTTTRGTMSHDNETTLRTAYAAFAKGDVPGFLALCTPDITFSVPGQGLLGGRHTTGEFLARLGPAMQAVAGTFREEVLGVLVSDNEGAVLVAQRAERDGKLHRWNAVHWYRIVGGKLAEFRELVDDSAAFEAAWRS